MAAGIFYSVSSHLYFNQLKKRLRQNDEFMIQNIIAVKNIKGNFVVPKKQTIALNYKSTIIRFTGADKLVPSLVIARMTVGSLAVKLRFATSALQNYYTFPTIHLITLNVEYFIKHIFLKRQNILLTCLFKN